MGSPTFRQQGNGIATDSHAIGNQFADIGGCADHAGGNFRAAANRAQSGREKLAKQVELRGQFIAPCSSGKLFNGAFQTACHGGGEFMGLAFGSAPVHASDRHDLFGRVDFAFGDFHEQIVAQDSLGRLIAVLGLGLTPIPELAYDRQVAGAEFSNPRDTAPILAIAGGDDFVLPQASFGFEPFVAVEVLQYLGELFMQWEQIADIFQGVIDLCVGQRPTTPIGALFSFGGLMPQEFAHHRTVGRRKFIATKARGDLYVVNLFGKCSQGGTQKEIEFLTPGMEHRDVVAGRHHFPERSEIGECERIDRGQVMFGGDLNKAKLGVKGVFRNEFGVDANRRCRLEPFA